MAAGIYAIVTLIIDLVAMVFGAFGAALLDMFPEEIEKSAFATGYAAFVSVVLLFLVRIGAQRFGWGRGTFFALFLLGAAVYVGGGAWYRESLDAKLFRYPNPQSEDLYLAGCERTEVAEAAVSADPRLVDPLLLVFEFAARPEHNFVRVWTFEGMETCRRRLFLHYVAIVGALVFAIGCAVEIVGSHIGPRTDPDPPCGPPESVPPEGSPATAAAPQDGSDKQQE